MVKREHGFTLAEVVVTIAIIMLMSSLAVLSGVGVINSARMSLGASRLADGLALSRQKSIALYQQWRVRFITDANPASRVSHGYVIESCLLAVGSALESTCSTWSQQGLQVDLEPTVGYYLPIVDGNVVRRLVFNRAGLFLGGTLDIKVCTTEMDASGLETCKSGSTARVIRVHGTTGVVET